MNSDPLLVAQQFIIKCITKLLCEKLDKVLPHIISQTQGAFISGRNILHNVLLCQDLMKIYKPNQKQACCLMKLDIRKAYDTVEWNFISEMMHQLQFLTHFINMIMMYVTTTSYALMINGCPSDSKERAHVRRPSLSSFIHIRYGVCIEDIDKDQYYASFQHHVSCRSEAQTKLFVLCRRLSPILQR